MSKDATPPIVVETVLCYKVVPPKNGTENVQIEWKSVKDGETAADKKAKIIISLLVLILLLTCVLIAVSAILLRKNALNATESTESTESTKQSDLSVDQRRLLRLVTRSEWIAQAPNDVLDDLELPVSRIVITHTAGDNCSSQATCIFQVRFIQTFHMESRHWDDIGFNFLVGGDGAAYEGRGWDKVGAHTKGFNVGSLGIAFIGTFTKYAPPACQLQVAQLLIQEGVRLGKVSPNYKLYGHRQLIPSESPGEKLFEIIKTWPHWSESVDY